MNDILKSACLGAGLLFSVVAEAATYVSQALGVLDSNGQPVTQLFGSAGNPVVGPVPVEQALILGQPDNSKWVSFTLGQKATFGFGGLGATGSLFVSVLPNGADETGTLFGREKTDDPWVELGSITEPNVGPLGTPPNNEVFNLTGTGLNYVNQVMIVSGSSSGLFPGLDIQGIGAETVAPVPLPATIWLLSSVFVGMCAFLKGGANPTRG